MNRYTILVKADKLTQVIPITPEFENRELEVIIKLPERKKFNATSFKPQENLSVMRLYIILMMILQKKQQKVEIAGSRSLSCDTLS